MSDIHWQENGLLGYYLGLSDIVSICKKNQTSVPWDYVEKRLVELRTEHDKLHQAEALKCHN